jgi:hypothetical protein
MVPYPAAQQIPNWLNRQRPIQLPIMSQRILAVEHPPLNEVSVVFSWIDLTIYSYLLKCLHTVNKLLSAFLKIMEFIETGTTGR